MSDRATRALRELHHQKARYDRHVSKGIHALAQDLRDGADPVVAWSQVCRDLAQPEQHDLTVITAACLLIHLAQREATS